VTLADIASLDRIDFDAFRADHPGLGADGPGLVARLATALEPTFA
jgi:hypothetical protein